MMTTTEMMTMTTMMTTTGMMTATTMMTTAAFWLALQEGFPLRPPGMPPDDEDDHAFNKRMWAKYKDGGTPGGEGEANKESMSKNK